MSEPSSSAARCLPAVEHSQTHRAAPPSVDEAERQVAARAREHDGFWQASPDMLGVTDGHGVWTRVNPAWERTLGWPPEQILGRTADWLEHPDTAEPMARRLQGQSPSQDTPAFEHRLRARDGTFHLFSWTVVALDGSWFCIARDITEERARETALRDSMDFTRLALAAVSGVGAWTYDVASDRFFCDAAIAEVYGVDTAEAQAGIQRARFLANVHPDDLAALRTTMAGGLVRSGDLELEYRVCHPDGSTRWVLSRGHTYFDAAGRPMRRTGVGIDMTTQRLLEEQLRQSQKMEAVGQLTGGLAHDFNNLLQGVMGPLELVRRLIALHRTQDLERYIGMAMSSAQKAAALTHRLLAFSRRQPLDPKHVDANALVLSLGDLLRRTTGEQVPVELVLDAAPCHTRCDANQLESALLNLSLNARDAMPEGGTLTIQTAHEEIDRKYAATQRGVKPGRYISIAVTDTGEGMPPDVARQAFEPFFTTKPLGQGTGLGLSMVYGFAGQSGGFATLYSHVGLGTTIRIYLPETEGEATTVDAQSEHADLQTGAGETILVVEDDENVRQLLIDLFAECGYVILHATDGPSGLAIIESDARIDLLVSDVGLPGLNGRQMADAARLRRPGLRILFTTGYAELAAVNDGFLAPGMQMITKPFSVEKIVQRVQQMLGTPALRGMSGGNAEE
ncbi:PAS domain-containing protein [Robbsia sp. Bb-Pol-6]|uniref:histidine kinase n=1 Tax=Robbsia betulipollinis TaxID=2981849 RepID=A0ABT3ZPN2_9BURK|nr:PAS domain-containing protein [Robbsia betulipollinis]MCY0388514.1 PAS domain-containing protein [Robbsia betulipollinis]